MSSFDTTVNSSFVNCVPVRGGGCFSWALGRLLGIFGVDSEWFEIVLVQIIAQKRQQQQRITSFYVRCSLWRSCIGFLTATFRFHETAWGLFSLGMSSISSSVHSKSWPYTGTGPRPIVIVPSFRKSQFTGLFPIPKSASGSSGCSRRRCYSLSLHFIVPAPAKPNACMTQFSYS